MIAPTNLGTSFDVYCSNAHPAEPAKKSEESCEYFQAKGITKCSQIKRKDQGTPSINIASQCPKTTFGC